MINHKAKLFLLIILTMCVFSPSLFNDFSGDDASFLKNNPFYHNPGNISRLFSKDYNVDPNSNVYLNVSDKGTGSVAYRPALSITYFWDAFIWGDNAFGFHLTNLIIHLANVALVYVLLVRLLPGTQWLGACLFAIHPIQTEAVCSIGFRADLLACFWCLISFLSWVISREKSSIKFVVVSAIAYFLGIFSKESAVPLIFLLIFYDALILRIPNKHLHLIKRSLFHCAVLMFYLYLYFFIFRNTSLNISFGNKGIPVYILSMFLIWHEYLQSFVLPFILIPLPPFYSPQLSAGSEFWIILPIVTAIVFWGSFVYVCRKHKTLAFFLLWYIIFYLPISGVIPQPIPIAHRFMYLPAIGILSVLAYAIQEIVKRFSDMSSLANKLSRFILPTIIATLAICTFTLTFYWRNNYSLGKIWTTHYPDQYIGYQLLAKVYYNESLGYEAIPHFKKTIALGNPNPTNYYELGQFLLEVGQTDEAFQYLEKVTRDHPNYSDGHFGLGRIYKLRRDFKQAIIHFRTALDQTSKQEAGHYFQLADCYLRTGQKDRADALTAQAEQMLDPTEHKKLMWLMNNKALGEVIH